MDLVSVGLKLTYKNLHILSSDFK